MAFLQEKSRALPSCSTSGLVSMLKVAMKNSDDNNRQSESQNFRAEGIRDYPVYTLHFSDVMITTQRGDYLSKLT